MSRRSLRELMLGRPAFHRIVQGLVCTSRRSIGPLLVAFLVVLVTPALALAVPIPQTGRRGLAAAQKGDCVSAVPLLEASELESHSPVAAFQLAKCYVALGRLLDASSLFHAVADEVDDRPWTGMDRVAVIQSATEGKKIDERIPTLTFEPAKRYEDLLITVDGAEVSDPRAPRKVPPDLTIEIVATAEGHRPLRQELVLREGDARVLGLTLEPAPRAPPKSSEQKGGGADPPARSTTWLGARFRGYVVPQLVMGAFVDGGTTLFLPSAELTLTTALDDADLVLSLGYTSYRMGETLMKPPDAPVTDYEIVESDLQALEAKLELMWEIPLSDDGAWAFRIGGGAGIGWTFVGDLQRTQAYPEDGDAEDLASFRKCDGPNDPVGTFRYCNQLDSDADHYGGYAEPSWFDGGARPLVYPWFALPELELTWYPSESVAIDLDAGLSTSGIMTGLGVRFGL